MTRDLPTGTVTFLFTDIEGSTKLLHELGAEVYAEALADHRTLLRDAFARHGGVEVDTQGDAFFYAFPTAPGALEAAREGQERLSRGPISVRMGVHTGTPHAGAEGYVGEDVHRAARIAAVAHGGQVVVSASTATLVKVALVDLGEHRLKDLSAPERIYQLGDSEFPPLKSLHQSNLPVPTTPFLGRERELADVVGLLGARRLLTLTGPGGTGKTRLALQAAGVSSDAYPHGVWWVPLAPLRDPALVLETAAQVVGSKNGLAEHIGDKRMLVLFDNFEQVVQAAGDVADLLGSCPNLDLLVTSREALHVTGEQEYPVPPLVHEEGVGFFLARARAVKPSFQPDDAVSEICRRLDDLPLALELAAARVKALSSAQILERLEQRLPLLTGGARDVPERQQTLRGAIAWSYDLLYESEHRLFARLSVFRGGCTLEAAEGVAGADLDTLASLVDKSLLRHTDERYWMLETIREYASEKLDESGEAEELRRRHAQHYLSLAMQLEPYVPVEKEWLDRLEAEHDNLRAALDGLPSQGDAELALQLAESAWRFWKMRGHQSEAHRRFETLLAVDPTPTAARGHALNAAAGMAVDNGDYEVGRRLAEEGLAIHRKHEDAWGIARSTYMLGYAAIEAGDFAKAKPLFEDTVRLMAELGYEQYVGQATFNLAWACDELGDVTRGKELSSDNLRRARAIRSRNLEAASLDSLAGYAHDEGRFEDALVIKRDSLRILCDLGDVQHMLDSLSRIADTHAHMARGHVAAELLSASLALHEEVGLTVPLYQQRRNDAMLELLHEQLDGAAFAEAWDQGKNLTLDEAVELALGES